jgi:hypothetical protein
MTCYIYMIVADMNSLGIDLGYGDKVFFKIGIAKDMKNRLRPLRTSNPLTVDVGRAWRCPGRFVARTLEAAIHDALSHCHERGEWFLLAIDEANNIIDRVIGGMNRAPEVHKAELAGMIAKADKPTLQQMTWSKRVGHRVWVN